MRSSSPVSAVDTRLLLSLPTRLESVGEEEQQVKALIRQLHQYNEVKDLAQALIGQLANIEGCTTRELYPRFGLNIDD